MAAFAFRRLILPVLLTPLRDAQCVWSSGLVVYAAGTGTPRE